MKKLTKTTDFLMACFCFMAIWMGLAFLTGVIWGGGAWAFQTGVMMINRVTQFL